MKEFGLNELRQNFLEFFEGKDHHILPSASLVPQNDKSLLLINSGMAPLKSYFTGQETPPSKRVASCQKCIRTPDIDIVGRTARHGTFFEMLGNFSFGDYFKEEAIAWAWEYVIDVLGLSEDKLWITIYEEDDEAFDIWTKNIGVAADRVVAMGKEDNFWEIGIGPCGPCSEIFYDRGIEHGCGEESCELGCECDRFVEFWNLVFTQFNKDEEGNYHLLDNPSIDTGMGLERIAAIMQDVDSLFEVDTIKSIMDEVALLSNKKYGEDEDIDVSLRVVTDHIRSTVFMISDGVLPSNEGRGYVLRRILRRAARHGKLIGIEDLFLTDLAKIVIEMSKEAYPNIKERENYILKVIQVEEERFNETIDQGLAILREHIRDIKERKSKILDGNRVFKLYDTYGFPVDLTKEILDEEGIDLDQKAFESLMEIQRERARAARQDTDYLGSDNPLNKAIKEDDDTEFVGYDHLKFNAEIIGIIRDNKRVESASDGDEVFIILDKTPFYAESGGQIGDKGFIYTENSKVIVEDVVYILGDHVLHKAKVEGDDIHILDRVEAVVDEDRRLSTARNHSTTHLLHRALKDVLGDHVEQAGSYVSPDRLRFDFSHFAAMTKEEILQVEYKVNDKIMACLNIDTMETDFDEAREMGATALFGEKYDDIVRVVRMGDYSTELCGGTHLKNTGQIGIFKIISEAGIAAGVRRIEAITGVEVQKWINENMQLIEDVSSSLKTNPRDLIKRAEGLLEQIREKDLEIQQLKREASMGSVDELLAKKTSVRDVNLIVAELDSSDVKELRETADILRDKIQSGVVILASSKDGKVNFVTVASKDLIKRAIHSGKLAKELASITGGGGGGRPDMAQAGGRHPEKIEEAFSKVKDIIIDQLDGK